MKEKYQGCTPRPWINVRNNNIRTDEPIDSCTFICQVMGHPDSKEIQANKRLITDAPMLAEQNEKMLGVLKGIKARYLGQMLAGDAQFIRDLIAEVEVSQ